MRNFGSREKNGFRAKFLFRRSSKLFEINPTNQKGKKKREHKPFSNCAFPERFRQQHRVGNTIVLFCYCVRHSVKSLYTYINTVARETLSYILANLEQQSLCIIRFL